MDKENILSVYNGLILGHKELHIWQIYRKIDAPGKYNTEWNNPELNYSVLSLVWMKQSTDKENDNGQNERDKKTDLLESGSSPKEQRWGVRRKGRGNKKKWTCWGRKLLVLVNRNTICHNEQWGKISAGMKKGTGGERGEWRRRRWKEKRKNCNMYM